ncbi:hypothetical protein EI171_20745 [Bradyrhizobium sp. LCT2]|nr:hypothetical protein EI171_20745 [Bradyrhizobium sp. LCT2]
MRAQRSNPESLRGDSLDCFAALAMTVVMQFVHTSPMSSWRKPGPITPVGVAEARCGHQRSQQPSSVGMGPGFRQDDTESGATLSPSHPAARKNKTVIVSNGY